MLGLVQYDSEDEDDKMQDVGAGAESPSITEDKVCPPNLKVMKGDIHELMS
jgi:hypothetical protein